MQKAKLINPAIIMGLSSLELRARTLVEGKLSGLHSSPYHGFSSEFSEYRPYSEGTSVRMVDWKKYAKTERLYEKRFRDETNLNAMIMLDSSASMAMDASGPFSKFEYSKTLAAALAYLLQGQRDAVGLCLLNDSVRFYQRESTKREQLVRIIRELEKAGTSGVSDMGNAISEIMPKLRRRSMVIIISDFLDNISGLVQSLRRLSSMKEEVMLLAIEHPSEALLDYRQESVFKDMETGEKIYVDPVHLNENYKKIRLAHFKELEQSARKLSIPLVKFSIETPFERPLRMFIAKREHLV